MVTKREILIAICEQPGWAPPEDGSHTERYLEELQAEGWIAPRLDGWMATAKAMDEYPYFLDQADIAEEPPPVEPHEYVARERVVNLVVGFLQELPLQKVFAIAATQHPASGPEWQVATHIVEEMSRVHIPA